MKKAASSVGDPGRVLICFDFEAPYGTPYKDEPYDLAKNTTAILDELAKHDARAVFFVVGRMAEDHPDIVQAIARRRPRDRTAWLRARQPGPL